MKIKYLFITKKCIEFAFIFLFALGCLLFLRLDTMLLPNIQGVYKNYAKMYKGGKPIDDVRLVLLEGNASHKQIMDVINKICENNPAVLGVDIFFEEATKERVDSILIKKVNLSNSNIVCAYDKDLLTTGYKTINYFFKDLYEYKLLGFTNFIEYSDLTIGIRPYQDYEDDQIASFATKLYNVYTKKEFEEENDILIDYQYIIKKDTIKEKELDIMDFSEYENKIVILGCMSYDDIKNTPYGRKYGCEIQSYATATLIYNESKPFCSKLLKFFLLVLFTLFLTLLFVLIRKWLERKDNNFSSIVLVGFYVISYLFPLISYSEFNQMVVYYLAVPTLIVLAAFIFDLIILFIKGVQSCIGKIKKIILIFFCLLSVNDVYSQSDRIVSLISNEKHTANITDMATNLEDSLYATVANDKTLRVWDMNTLTPKAIIRMPEDHGNYGQLNSCSFNPINSDVIFVTGKIGTKRKDARIPENGTYSFYVINWKEGRIIDKEGQFNSPVQGLLFSPDGSVCAAYAEYEQLSFYNSYNMTLIHRLSFNDEFIEHVYLQDNWLLVVTDIAIRKYILSYGDNTLKDIRLIKKIRKKTKLSRLTKDHNYLICYNESAISDLFRYDPKTYKLDISTMKLTLLDKSYEKFIELDEQECVPSNMVTDIALKLQYRKRLAPSIEIHGDTLEFAYDGPVNGPYNEGYWSQLCYDGDNGLCIYSEGYDRMYFTYPFQIWKDYVKSDTIFPTLNSTVLESGIDYENYFRLKTRENEYIKAAGDLITRRDSKYSFYDRYLPYNSAHLRQWNDNYFIASLEDGTIRWYDIETGTEQLSFFYSKDDRWIFWVPEGYFYGNHPSVAALVEWRQQVYQNVVAKSFGMRESYYNDKIIYEKISRIFNHTDVKMNDLEATKYPQIKIDSISFLGFKGEDKILLVDFSVYNYDISQYGLINIQLEADGKICNYTSLNFTPSGYMEAHIPQNTKRVDIKLLSKNVLLHYDFYELIKEKILEIDKVRAWGIGITTYDTFEIKNLSSPRNDVNDLFSLLGNYIYGKENRKMFPFLRLFDQEATYKRIIERIEKIGNEVGENDLSIFYFSGHGTVEGNRLLLTPFDADWSNRERMLSATDFFSLISHMKGYKIVIIDACHSGQLLNEFPNDPTMAIFTSSLPDKTSEDGDAIGRSMFTEKIIKAIKNVEKKQMKFGLSDIKNELIKSGVDEKCIYIPKELNDCIIFKIKNL